MENKVLKFKNDKFKKARAGYSRWLQLSCGECKALLFVYQKDGAGILKRLYIDRIADAQRYRGNLICVKCKTLLGIRTVYKKENRLAYRLFAGAIEGKVIKI